MKTSLKEKANAIAKLTEASAVNEKREDRHGETKSGWWQDGVFLAKNPIEAYRLMMGGG